MFRKLIVSSGLFLSALSLVSSPETTAQNGVTFLGSVTAPHGVSAAGTFSFSSCWGWVAPDGHEYALLGTCEGTSIIDLDAVPLRETQYVPGAPSASCYREIKTYKQYAYIVSEGGLGVQIVDLSGLPREARLVKNFIYSDSVTRRSTEYSHTITAADGYLYLNGSSHWPPGGTLIFSLREDPTEPRFVGAFQPDYLHDSYVRNDTLYGAAIYPGGGLYVVDIRDKARPIELGKIEYPGSGTHNAWASIDGKFAFTTDEIGSTAHNLKIWKIDSLPAYSNVAEYRADPASIIHNVHGRGKYLYISHYTAGMRVVDVHDPANPVEAGYYDTYSGPSGGFAGCWGVYPYFPSGRWIGSDMQSGLFVCRFDRLIPRRRVQLLNRTDMTLTKPEGVLRWSSAADQAEDPHFYELHLRSSSIDTSFQTRDTSFSLMRLPSIITTDRYQWYVVTRDEYTEVTSADTGEFLLSAGQVNGPPRLSNTPNPFAAGTMIQIILPQRTQVSLTVFNVLGQAVRSLYNHEILDDGVHDVEFRGEGLPSGMYFCRLEVPGSLQWRKMVLLR